MKLCKESPVSGLRRILYVFRHNILVEAISINLGEILGYYLIGVFSHLRQNKSTTSSSQQRRIP